MKQVLLLVVLIICYGSMRLSAQINIDSVTQRMDTIFKKYNHIQGPGCAVAVIKDGQVIFEKTYGMGNLEYNQPLTANSVFDIGSLTKQFTGFAISTLIQQGKISLKDDIRKYLPWVPNFGKVITIDMLIHHTSGLRDYPGALMVAGWQYNELATLADVKQLVEKQQDLDFVPGTQESYCNTGYVLLAAIVEKVTGESFPVWMKENVFKPLKMDASFVLDDHGRVIPNLATSYALNGQDYSKYSDILTAYGSSCMYTSLADLAKWVIHFQEMIRLQDPIYMRMEQEGSLNDGEKVPYGFGLEIGSEEGMKTISHTGAWVGYRTNIRNYPDQHFAFITLCNADDNDLSGPYARAIFEVFLKDQSKGEAIDRVKAMPTRTLPVTVLNKYTGDWLLGPPANKVFKFTADSGHLTLHLGSTTFRLESKTDHQFYFAADNSAIDFVSAETFHYESSTNTITGRRIKKTSNAVAFSPDSKQLQVYCGSFYSSELETQYKVYTLNGKLMIHHFRLGDFELVPVKDQFNVFNSDIGTLDFYTDQQHHISGFKLSGDRVRNIRFAKVNVTLVN
jgi:CubicO group peptidase (beta-lactamase class C family)